MIEKFLCWIGLHNYLLVSHRVHADHTYYKFKCRDCGKIKEVEDKRWMGNK